jgi:hypothetical protein
MMTEVNQLDLALARAIKDVIDGEKRLFKDIKNIDKARTYYNRYKQRGLIQGVFAKGPTKRYQNEMIKLRNAIHNDNVNRVSELVQLRDYYIKVREQQRQADIRLIALEQELREEERNQEKERQLAIARDSHIEFSEPHLDQVRIHIQGLVDSNNRSDKEEGLRLLRLVGMKGYLNQKTKNRWIDKAAHKVYTDALNETQRINAIKRQQIQYTTNIKDSNLEDMGYILPNIYQRSLETNQGSLANDSLRLAKSILPDIINSIPCNVSITMVDNDQEEHRSSPIYVNEEHRNTSAKDVAHVIRNMFDRYAMGRIVEIFFVITPKATNQDFRITYVAQGKQMNCMIKLSQDKGIDCTSFLTKYPMYDTQNVLPMDDFALNRLSEETNCQYNIYSAIARLCLNNEVDPHHIYGSQGKYERTKKVNAILENGHCSLLRSRPKEDVSQRIIYHSQEELDQAFLEWGICIYPEYSKEGQLSYFYGYKTLNVNEPLVIHKKYDERLYTLDNVNIVDDSQALFHLCLRDYNIIEDCQIITDCIKSSEVFLGCNLVKEYDSNTIHYAYDCIANYPSCVNYINYGGFPCGRKAMSSILVEDQTSHCIIKSVNCSSKLSTWLRRFNIVLVEGLCITYLDLLKYREMGIEIEVDYYIICDRWEVINLYQLMDKYKVGNHSTEKERKIVRNSTIGKFISGGINGIISRTVKCMNNSEEKMIITDCEKLGWSYYREGNNMHIEIEKETKGAYMGVHSWFLSYAKWLVFDAIRLEESVGNTLVGYKTDMIMFEKECQLLKLGTKPGQWKVEGVNEAFWQRKTIKNDIVDYSLLSHHKQYTRSNGYLIYDSLGVFDKCIKGNPGIGKSMEARTPNRAGVALTDPTWELVGDHNVDHATTNASYFHLTLSDEAFFIKKGKKVMPLICYIDEAHYYESKHLDMMRRRAPYTIFIYLYDNNQQLGIVECVTDQWFDDRNIIISEIKREANKDYRHTYDYGCWLDKLRGMSHAEIAQECKKKYQKYITFDSSKTYDNEEDWPKFVIDNHKKIKEINNMFRMNPNVTKIPCIAIDKTWCTINGKKVQRRKKVYLDKNDPRICYDKDSRDYEYPTIKRNEVREMKETGPPMSNPFKELKEIMDGHKRPKNLYEETSRGKGITKTLTARDRAIDRLHKKLARKFETVVDDVDSLIDQNNIKSKEKRSSNLIKKHQFLPYICLTPDSIIGSTIECDLVVDVDGLKRGNSLYIAITRGRIATKTYIM